MTICLSLGLLRGINQIVHTENLARCLVKASPLQVCVVTTALLSGMAWMVPALHSSAITHNWLCEHADMLELTGVSSCCWPSIKCLLELLTAPSLGSCLWICQQLSSASRNQLLPDSLIGPMKHRTERTWILSWVEEHMLGEGESRGARDGSSLPGGTESRVSHPLGLCSRINTMEPEHVHMTVRWLWNVYTTPPPPTRCPDGRNNSMIFVVNNQPINQSASQPIKLSLLQFEVSILGTLLNDFRANINQVLWENMNCL
jgi:hypothetical protein